MVGVLVVLGCCCDLSIVTNFVQLVVVVVEKDVGFKLV